MDKHLKRRNHMRLLKIIPDCTSCNYSNHKFSIVNIKKHTLSIYKQQYLENIQEDIRSNRRNYLRLLNINPDCTECKYSDHKFNKVNIKNHILGIYKLLFLDNIRKDKIQNLHNHLWMSYIFPDCKKCNYSNHNFNIANIQIHMLRIYMQRSLENIRRDKNC